MRQSGKPVVEQHELRHRARRWGTSPHGHTNIGIFEGKHIVNAVPGHGDCAACLLEGLHDVAFLFGGHTPEHPPVHYCLPEGEWVAGECAGVDRRINDAELVCHGPNGGRMVTRYHLDLYVFLLEVVEGVGGVGPQLLPQNHQRYGFNCRRPVTRRQQQHPQPAFFQRLGLFQRFRTCWQQHIRRAKHPVSQLGKRHSGPFAGRVEGHTIQHFVADVPVANAFRNGVERVVGPVVRSDKSLQHAVHSVKAGVTKKLDVFQFHAVFSESSGFVGAYHVDSRKSFDGR